MSEEWTVPSELDRYTRYTDHPGRAEELMNSTESVFVNAPKAVMRAGMSAQYRLLARLHHAGLLDLPCDSCGMSISKGCPDCGACKAGCHGGHENNPCTHENAPWGN